LFGVPSVRPPKISCLWHFAERHRGFLELMNLCIVLRMHCPLNISRRIHLLCCSLMKNHSIARLRQEPRAFRPGVCRSESRTGSLHQRFRSRFEGVYVSFQEVGVFVWRITSQLVLWKQRVAQLPLAAGCGLEALQLYKHTPLNPGRQILTT